MALNLLLRKAGSSAIPLAVRAVGSPRTYHRLVSSLLSVDKQILGPDVCRQSSVPFLHFSTSSSNKRSSDESLIKAIESEIEFAIEDEASRQPDEVPSNFSFKIQDNPGERTIMLEKEFQGEIITVQVDEPTHPEKDENEEHEPEEDKNEDDDEEEEETEPPSLPLVVSITKGDGVSLEFGITAYMDDFTIDRLSVKDPEICDDELAYEGPNFDDLDANLQKALNNYLEVRGINSTITNYLLSYMINKEEREHLQWLKGIKNFVAK